MARDPKRLYGPAQLGNSAATVYTVPAATKTIIRNIHLQNPPGGSNRTVTISIGSDAAGTRIYREYPVATGQVVPIWTYFVLEAGEVLQAYADAASAVVITVDGDEIGSFGLGVPVLLGPFPVDYTDVLNHGNEFDLLVLPAGTAVVDWWGDAETAVQFATAGPTPIQSTLSLGQIAAFNPTVVADGQWGYADFITGGGNTTVADADQNSVAGDHYDNSGNSTKSSLVITEGTSAVRVVNTAGGAYVAGHVELWFLVVAPPFPTEL